MQNELTGFQISPQQRRGWALLQDGCRLVVQRASWLDAAPDAETLRAAVLAVFGAHDVMRTTIRRPPGIKVPLQVVTDEPTIAWRVAEGPLDAVCAAEIEAGVDPEEGPGVRVACLPDGERKALVVTASPLLADGRSLELLLEALADHLAAPGAAVPEVAVQHVHFSEWQNEVAEEVGSTGPEGTGPDAERPVLPFLRPIADRTGGRPRTHRDRLPAELAAGLRDAAGPEGVDAVLLAAWAVLLRSLTGVDRLEIARSVDVRPVEDLAGVVGPLAKRVPMTLGLRGDFHLSEVRQRAATALEEAAERQESFFRPAEGGRGTALGFEIEAGACDRSLDWSEPYELKLTVAERDRGLDLTLYGAAERVSGDDLELLALRLRAVLEAFAEDGDPLVEDAERRLHPAECQLLEGFAAGSGATAESSFLDRFRAAVERDPGAPAVIAGGETVDYRALDRRSDAVARALVGLGVGPESLVGLWAERSVAAIVGLLGVLKAGGAFVPLDPALPVNRLAHIAGEVEMAAMVVGSAPPASLVEAVGDERMVSAVDPAMEDGPVTASDLPETAAYLLFTSGSTGEPKGVVVSRGHLASYVAEIVERLGFEPGERFASVSTLAADLGHTMVFPALATGGALVLFSAEEIGDPRAFARAMTEHRVDALKIVPTHLGALLQESDPSKVMPRRRLVLGGERTSLDLAERVLSAADCEVHNHYGPTEATVGVATQDVRSWWREPRSASVPVGRPLGTTRIDVVDAGFRRAPLWVTGEIVLGGDHVARGYHGRPAATASVFVPDPFSGRSGARLYRTGDLGRVLGDGSVEFVGRRDRQLKIRGFRVEIGEIEATLRRHPAVRAAVVVPREDPGDGAGNVRLIAYVVPEGDEEAGSDLHDFLRAELPAFMVPHGVEPIESVPRTPNGKVDVAALPEPGAAGRAERPYVAPRGPVEELVAELWQELLGRERVGVHDDFFEIGGHSLLAMQLLSRVRRTFSVELPLPVIFDRTTVEELAETLVEHEPAPGQVEKVAKVHLKVRAMSADEIESELGARTGVGEGGAA